MNTTRRLLLFSCAGLLAGCMGPFAGPSCYGPGEGYGSGQWCHYAFEITKVDLSNWLVQGVVPDQVFKDGGSEVPKNKKLFSFRVRDLDKVKDQIQVGQVYNFSGQDDSPYVELLPRELQ